MASDKLIPIVIGPGELYYVNITGQGKENYNGDGFDYVGSIRLPKEKAQPHIDAIEACLGPVPKGLKVKSRGWRELLEDEEGVYTPTSTTEESGRDEKAKKTGIIQFTFKTNTTFADGKPKKVGVFNSANPPTKLNMGDKLIGNGSVGCISGKMQRVERGKEVMVSLYLNAIQLVKFEEYQGDAGFSAQEGGMVSVSEQPEAEGPASEESRPAEQAKTSKPKL